MDPVIIFGIIKTALNIAEGLTSGTHVQGDIATIAALEEIVQQTLTAHQSETGAPMDLSKFHHQAHIE